MDWAERVAQLSHAKRLQVGSVIVKDDTVISYGYNGTPAGWDNNCEDKVFNTQYIQQKDNTWIDPNTYKVVDIEEHYPFIATSDEDDSYIGHYRLKTKPEVMHSERNALDKLARQGNVGGSGADIFITHAPCLECAKSILGAGIKRVYFGTAYRDNNGVEFLEKSGVGVIQVDR
jgi:dCMP deaminase